MPPPSRRLNDKSLNQILTASKSSLVTAGEISNKNRWLYGTGDLGEVYAISLAQTLGAYSLVTDDTKQGGPYMSLLQYEDDIMPFTFAG